MDGPKVNSVTRISVGRRWISLPTIALLYACFIVALFFSIGAIKRSREPVWWLCTGLAILSACALIWRDRHRKRDWNDVAHIELHDGTIAFMPRRMMRHQGWATAKAPFPVSSGLECHIATGDRYFTGDHGQTLLKSLWIVQPDGTRHSLLSDVIDLNLPTMVTSLRNSGISFRVINVYDGQEGEHTETDITSQYVEAPRRSLAPISILLATTNMWLGVLASSLTHNAGYVVVIGVLGFVTMAIFSLRSKTSKRSALVQVATLVPSYAAGYAFAVIVVWYIFKR
jgi:hypothetical protein